MSIRTSWTVGTWSSPSVVKIGFVTVVFFHFFSMDWMKIELFKSRRCKQLQSASLTTIVFHLPPLSGTSKEPQRHLSGLLLVACTSWGSREWSKEWYETSFLVFGEPAQVCFMHIGLNIPQNTIKYTIFSYTCFDSDTTAWLSLSHLCSAQQAALPMSITLTHETVSESEYVSGGAMTHTGTCSTTTPTESPFEDPWVWQLLWK